jgi:hypothetical protein
MAIPYFRSSLINPNPFTTLEWVLEETAKGQKLHAGLDFLEYAWDLRGLSRLDFEKYQVGADPYSYMYLTSERSTILAGIYESNFLTGARILWAMDELSRLKFSKSLWSESIPTHSDPIHIALEYPTLSEDPDGSVKKRKSSDEIKSLFFDRLRELQNTVIFGPSEEKKDQKTCLLLRSQFETAFVNEVKTKESDFRYDMSNEGLKKAPASKWESYLTQLHKSCGVSSIYNPVFDLLADRLPALYARIIRGTITDDELYEMFRTRAFEYRRSPDLQMISPPVLGLRQGNREVKFQLNCLDSQKIKRYRQSGGIYSISEAENKFLDLDHGVLSLPADTIVKSRPLVTSKETPKEQYREFNEFTLPYLEDLVRNLMRRNEEENFLDSLNKDGDIDPGFMAKTATSWILTVFSPINRTLSELTPKGLHAINVSQFFQEVNISKQVEILPCLTEPRSLWTQNCALISTGKNGGLYLLINVTNHDFFGLSNPSHFVLVDRFDSIEEARKQIRKRMDNTSL